MSITESPKAAPGVKFWQQAAVFSWPRFNPLWLLILPVIVVMVGVLLSVFWLSFLEGLPGTPDTRWTLSHYASLYADEFVLTALLNTLGFASTSVFVSLFFGGSIAWLVERTNLPGKSYVYTLMSLGLLVPGFFSAMGWLLLLHPRIGLVNQWLIQMFGLPEAPFAVSSVLGMGLVQGLGLASLAFIMTATTFRSMDPALEEAARAHGATAGQMMRTIFAPLVFPSVLASGLYIFTIAFASFDTPAILGLSQRIYTFSTFVYAKTTTTEALPDYGITAGMSTLMVALAILCSYAYGKIIRKGYQYEVITGKGYRPRLFELGAWKIAAWIFIGGYLAFSKILPFLLLIWAAVLPFFQPPSLQALSKISLDNFRNIPLELILRALSNTAVLMVVVPTVTLLVSFGFSWMVVRTRSEWRGVLDFFAFLPHAVPNIIFGVGALLVALFILNQFPLYGSLTLLAAVYVVTHLGLGTRLLNSALIQVHSELEEAAAVCGASQLGIARKILAPLVYGALLNGWLWMALLVSRELTLASVLFSPRNVTLPVVIWNLWGGAEFGVAAAISLTMLGAFAPLVLLYYWTGRSRTPLSATAR